VTFGVSVYDLTGPELIDVATAAEDAGFDQLWLGEHLLLPLDYESAHPSHTGPEDPSDVRYPRVVASSTHLLDPIAALAAVAAVTSRIRLGTAIYLLPLRHPLLTARAAASLSELSAGRFMLGVGAGWLEEEFEALHIPFQDRGSRHEESVEVLRRALAGGPFRFDGTHFRFGPVQVCPAPTHVPIVMGGNSRTALRRAARLGDAWFSSGNPPFDEAVRLRRALEQFRVEAGRPEPLECYVRLDRFDPEQARRYAEAGFRNLVFWAQDICPPGANRRDAFRRAAAKLGIGTADTSAT
jgi:probable F420-dependent oxidoreductase